MWGRQRRRVVRSSASGCCFSCHHYTETPEGQCGASLGLMAVFVTHVNGKCHRNLGKAAEECLEARMKQQFRACQSTFDNALKAPLWFLLTSVQQLITFSF